MMIPLDLPKSSRVLIVGAGGGYDFLCGLPVGLAVEACGSTVDYASYSFTKLQMATGVTEDPPNTFNVTADSNLPTAAYFPEQKFAAWYRERHARRITVTCFPCSLGVRQVRAAFDALATRHGFTHVIVVDGGVDGIMRGDETDLGTPSMDAITMIAAAESAIPTKLFAFTAFGSEGVNREVCHAQVLARIADLIKADKFFGTAMLLRDTPIGTAFLDCFATMQQQSQLEHTSNIVCSLVRAMHGDFGDTIVNQKNADRPLWVSPLTPLYWFCDLPAAARLKLYYDDVVDSTSVPEVNEAIERVRARVGVRKPERIPI